MNIFVPLRDECIIATEFSGHQHNFISKNTDTADVVFVDNPDRADLIIIFESWTVKFQDYAGTIERCPLIQEYLEKVVVINWDSFGRGFLPGCYVSLRV